MGYKILSIATLALSFVPVVLLGIVTFASATFANAIVVWLVSIGVFLMALRFNITALRNDLADRMVMPNCGLFFVSLFLIYIFVRHILSINSIVIPEFVTYCILGGLVAGFLVFFITYWVQRRRG